MLVVETNQEETDTHILLYLVHASQTERMKCAIVQNADKYVFCLLVHYCPIITAVKVYMKTRHHPIITAVKVYMKTGHHPIITAVKVYMKSGHQGKYINLTRYIPIDTVYILLPISCPDFYLMV